MAQEGIDMGRKEFYVVRADIHRLRGEPAPAFADYDRAIAEKTFKLNSFLAAGNLALRVDPGSSQAREKLSKSQTSK
jgi:hypothetical protein